MRLVKKMLEKRCFRHADQPFLHPAEFRQPQDCSARPPLFATSRSWQMKASLFRFSGPPDAGRPRRCE